MSPREFTLAKKAAASILAAAVLAATPAEATRRAPKPSKKSTGVAQALREKLAAANAAYESRKGAGATLAGIEREFDLKPTSLKSWRSRRMIAGDPAIQRTYTNRPLKKP
jgi:hypothetical protein